MEYCLPIAVRGWQNAENTETLLKKKVLQIGLNEKELMKLWLADGVYATLKEEDKALRLDAIDLAKEYFKNRSSIE